MFSQALRAPRATRRPQPSVDCSGLTSRARAGTEPCRESPAPHAPLRVRACRVCRAPARRGARRVRRGRAVARARRPEPEVLWEPPPVGGEPAAGAELQALEKPAFRRCSFRRVRGVCISVSQAANKCAHLLIYDSPVRTNGRHAVHRCSNPDRETVRLMKMESIAHVSVSVDVST